MAKKHWISIKRGLSTDPKHRERMGMCVWLFMMMVDSTDWETGIMYDWKDSDIAAEMSLNPRTVRDWRQKLEKEGYISCVQKQHNLEIVIHNWYNPKDYSGTKINVFEGDTSKNENNFEGDTQGDTQGRSQFVTPTYDSISISKEIPLKEKTKKKGDLVDGYLFFAGKAVEQRIEEVEDCLIELSKGLNRNIPRTPTWQDCAKWIIKQGNLKEWIKWYMSDKFRVENAWRMTPQQIKDSWPQAQPKVVDDYYKPYVPEPHPEYVNLMEDK